MRARRLLVGGLVVLLAGVATSCSAGDEGTAVSQTPRSPAPIPSDPVAALAAAQALLGTESARFTQDTGSDVLDFTGLVDAKTHNWEITGKEYTVRRVGTELYIRASGRTLELMMATPETTDRLAAGGWAHTRLPNGSGLSVVFSDTFPWNLAGPAARATAVTRTGVRSFSGTVSVPEAKYGTQSRNRKDADVDADLDEQGRFTSISLENSKVPGNRTLFTFSDYGTRATITAPPPGDVVEEENPSFTTGLGLF